ncbi:uncharacterized protein LOC117567022 isoform X4 [Drosophila albomicans]|uniref:Uncharacterized protein LOC117567022 isoform X4 n=1 Tax=Drosophila albomicans TaxID=7291 RepID=A0A6P8WHF9_DROAB|nr:uncharacterized protein LOC117567022 isoform X4 [Drosophila albomicans]
MLDTRHTGLYFIFNVIIIAVIVRDGLTVGTKEITIDYGSDIEICDGRTPVVVTSATHTAPGGYPVTTVPARTYQTTTYATTPYPAQTTGPNLTVQMPMPMPTAHSPMPGVQQPQGPPYPPVQQYPGASAANMNPPSYDAAMANSSPSVAAPGYEKQMPYNPNY